MTTRRNRSSPEAIPIAWGATAYSGLEPKCPLEAYAVIARIVSCSSPTERPAVPSIPDPNNASTKKFEAEMTAPISHGANRVRIAEANSLGMIWMMLKLTGARVVNMYTIAPENRIRKYAPESSHCRNMASDRNQPDCLALSLARVWSKPIGSPFLHPAACSALARLPAGGHEVAVLSIVSPRSVCGVQNANMNANDAVFS